MINVETVWWKIEAFTHYQVVAGEMAVRGRVQAVLNDPEPYVTLRHISTTPMLPGAPRLQAIGEGILSKPQVGALRTLEAEPPPPDQTMELSRRFLYFQGTQFNIQGSVQFPTAADPNLHRDMLFKAKFFPLFDAKLTVVGADLAPLLWPLAYVNRDLVVGLYLG